MTEKEIDMCQQVYTVIQNAKELGIKHFDLQVSYLWK